MTYLWDVICDTIATRPLSNRLHDSAKEEPFPIRRILRNILCDNPEGRALELLFLGLTLVQDLGVLESDIAGCFVVVFGWVGLVITAT